MKFKILNDHPVGGTGTSLQGYITDDIPYSRIKSVFGDAIESDGYKVSAEWIIEFEDGKIATIYDWKCTNLYDDDEPPPSAIRNDMIVPEWHIGGASEDVVARVGKLIGCDVRVT